MDLCYEKYYNVNSFSLSFSEANFQELLLLCFCYEALEFSLQFYAKNDFFNKVMSGHLNNIYFLPKLQLMSGKTKEWVDQCTSLKATDQNYQKAQNLVQKTGCSEQNVKLTECLHKYRKDWRQCKNETMQLNTCLKQTKTSGDQKN